MLIISYRDNQLLGAYLFRWNSRAEALNATLQRNLDAVTTRLIAHTSSIGGIVGACDEVINAIDRWNEILDRRISSRARDLRALTSNTTTWANHLQLRSYLPQALHTDVNGLRTVMVEWRTNFQQLNRQAKRFQNNLPNIQARLRENTLEMIYPNEEMQSKLATVKGIGLLLETCATEYNQIASQIRSQMNGRVIIAYATDLESTAKFFENLAGTIRDDFRLSW